MLYEDKEDYRGSLRKKSSIRLWRLAIGAPRDNAPARWLSTLSMGALLVLPQRYSVHRGQVRKEAAGADDVGAGM